MTTDSTADRNKISFDDATIVIGLEVHVQLSTDSKLFCGCSTAFGGQPNTQTCPVCTGMPGTLPVLNERAVKLAIKTGLALNCDIARYTKWDRKNYFYPDLPKGYQISQFDKPICGAGYLEIRDPKGAFEPRRVRLERAHLEEDAGKSMHDESNRGGCSKIDLNRTGTPLLEIVTKPDLRTAAEAKAFLTELKLILTYIRCLRLQHAGREPAVRCQCQLAYRHGSASKLPRRSSRSRTSTAFVPPKEQLITKANVNLPRGRKRGKRLTMPPSKRAAGTMVHKTTQLQREKEESADYRYFPDPDLIAYTTSEETIEMIRCQVGQLPAELRQQLTVDHQLKRYDANVIVGQGRGVVDFFLELADGVGNSKLAANWVGQEVLRYLNENNVTIEEYPVSAAQLTQLLSMIDAGEIDQTRAKDVLNEIIESGSDLGQAIKKLGIESISADEIAAIAAQLISDNPDVAQQIKDGNTKAVGSLIGKARKLNPNVNPGVVKDKDS